jgi:hypothetical protein
MNFADPLVIFQKAFWGVPLGSQYTELRDSITPSVADSMEIDTELGDSMILSVADGMEIDTDAAHEPDDDQGDLLPGTPLLDRSLEGVPAEILVRAEYIRIFKMVEQVYNERNVNCNRRPPAIVVTGQPGIGNDYLSLRN